MAKRVKHLLEAFQQTGAAGRAPGAPSAGAPSSTAPSSSTPAAARPLAAPQPQHGGSAARPVLSQAWITHGIVLCVGLLIGVLAGRFARPSEASAANPNASLVVEPRLQGGASAPLESGAGAPSDTASNASGASSSAASAANAAGGAQPTAIDAALRDKANRYSLLAITYGNSPANLDLARSTASYLRTKDLPACDPVLRGKTLCVLVGAAPSKAQLQELQSRLRGTLGPSGRGQDFTTAYAVDIDTYIAR